MKLVTHRYRLKDSSCRNRLRQMAWACNDVWNYCNEVNAYQWSFRRKILSERDLNKLTAGTVKELGISSQTVQAVCTQFAQSSQQFRRSKLNWRSRTAWGDSDNAACFFIVLLHIFGHISVR
jgi:hypothetical protein